MSTPILVAIISGLAVAIVPAFSYWLTKRQEREADRRRHKFEHYREFVLSLSEIVGTDVSPEGRRRFARSGNTLHLVASPQVMEALHKFRDEIADSNPSPSRRKHDELLTALLKAIRRDLKITQWRGDASFEARLWCSGTNEPAKNPRDLVSFLNNAPDVPPEPEDRL